MKHSIAVPNGQLEQFDNEEVSDEVFIVTTSLEECTLRGYPNLFGADVRKMTDSPHSTNGWIYVTTIQNEYIHGFGIPECEVARVGRG